MWKLPTQAPLRSPSCGLVTVRTVLGTARAEIRGIILRPGSTPYPGVVCMWELWVQSLAPHGPLSMAKKDPRASLTPTKTPKSQVDRKRKADRNVEGDGGAGRQHVQRPWGL